MIGKKIYDARKRKGLSQEELSELSKINVRTVQRIENHKNIPRGKTLNLLCDALDLDITELHVGIPCGNDSKEKMTGLFRFTVLNFILVLLFGYLTLDSEANTNSKFAATLLSVLLPYFIVSKTLNMTGTERLIRFGTGLIVYILLVALLHQFPIALLYGFYSSICTVLLVLYFGNSLLKQAD